MSPMNTEALLKGVAAGTVPVEDALLQLRKAPFEDLGFAKVDHHRKVRQGAAEVVYGEGKTAAQIREICTALLAVNDCVLVTRLDAEKAAQLEGAFAFSYHVQARVGIVGTMPEADGAGYIAVAAAGTSDIPVAEEAALTAEALGNKVVRLYDVGVAGLHRVLAHLDQLVAAQCIVAVAGMEGALPSVIAGMVSCPVIAVPTSVGYGASLGGVAALLSMLNSCASGVSVVNIDNGFGAAFQAHQINHLVGEAASGTQPQPKAAAGATPEETNIASAGPIMLDLSQSATRQSLLAQLEALMTPEQRGKRAQILREARIPNKHHHDIAEVNATIDALVAPAAVKEHLRGVYDILAHAEATAHGVPVEQTHFHEVGNGMGILNALNIVATFHVLAPAAVKATPVQTGKGTVMCAHGEMNIPAPATAAIIATGLPVVPAEDLLEGELCTPTSAAIIKHYVTEFVTEPEAPAAEPASADMQRLRDVLLSLGGAAGEKDE